MSFEGAKQKTIDIYKKQGVDLTHQDWFVEWLDKIDKNGYLKFRLKCFDCAGTGVENSGEGGKTGSITTAKECMDCYGYGEVTGPRYCTCDRIVLYNAYIICGLCQLYRKALKEYIQDEVDVGPEFTDRVMQALDEEAKKDNSDE